MRFTRPASAAQVNSKRARHARGEQYTTSTGGREDTTLEVPIFLISLDEETPVFIDKHYLAKSLPDLVLVVQNRDQTWDSHLACNDNAIKWNLRNPLKASAALASAFHPHTCFSAVWTPRGATGHINTLPLFCGYFANQGQCVGNDSSKGTLWMLAAVSTVTHAARTSSPSKGKDVLAVYQISTT